MTGDQWLARRTFDGAAVDPEGLARAKRDLGLTVSVCLPTLNVGDTVGAIVDSVRATWRDGDVRLVDEIVAVDSASADDTAARVASAGGRVVQEKDVLPAIGPGAGKGEAMWKSLAASTGDVVVWLDSDVVDFDPMFVPGLLHPLLTVPEVGYVKAVYRRKLGDGDEGGRVTEICARPLVNLFYPELAVLAQPLSGEAAGRRSLLERLPFMSGYAVEMGLLIDILGLEGLDAIAQVDLDERRHTNQPTAALGRMAYAIMRAVLARADGRELDASRAYLRPERDGDAGWRLHVSEVNVTERPPMVEVAGYPAGRAR